MTHEELMQQLREDLLDLNEQIQVIQAKADADKRDLTQDEENEIEALFNRFNEVEAEIHRRERINAQTSKLRQTVGQQTEPQDVEPQNQPRQNSADGGEGHQGFQKRTGYPKIEMIKDRKCGFHDFGEFANAVARANNRVDGTVDPRLRSIQNAPTTYGNESTGADGGFLVPPDFRTAIMEKVEAESGLYGRADNMTSSSNSITFPKDDTTPWQTTGGIQVYWEGEGNQLSQSKPEFGEETIKLNKLTALVPVTEELLDDASSLNGYLSRKVPEKMDFAINLAMIQGTGAGKPLGILNSDCLISVAKDTTTSPVQAADTLRYRNIVNMWHRMYAPCRSNSVWLMNQDVEEQLQFMEFPTNTGATAVPVYLPPGGLSQAPYGTLLGRPIVPTQACNTLGDQGDIILADLSRYMTVIKTGGIRSDVSIHLWFDYDMTAFRFIFRIGGQPWWSSAISPRDGSTTYSCFVTLDERA